MPLDTFPPEKVSLNPLTTSALLAGINDPYELLAEVIADNERLRQFINNHDCHKGKP